MERIRVLHVNKLYHPWTGGIESAVQQLAEGSRRFPELDTEVLVCQASGRSVRQLINGVPVHRTTSLGMGFSMPISPSYSLQLRAAKREFDIIHAHLPFPLALFGGWVGRGKGPRLVVHYHSDVVRPLQKGLMSAIKPLETRMLKAADVILVGSEPMIEQSPVLAPFKEKCTVLPYPVSTERLTSRTTNRECGNNDKPIVLFVGRLVYYKGVEYLIRAMKGVDAQLVIAGDGPLRGDLERLANELSIQDRVSFRGGVTDEELGLLYRRASVFVLPSIEAAEAFGLVQVEAMLHGVPVVNTALPTGVPTVSMDGETGFTVPPKDASSLSSAISRILEDRSLRSTFAANALKRAQMYSPVTVLEQLRSIYFRILGLDPFGTTQDRKLSGALYSTASP